MQSQASHSWRKIGDSAAFDHVAWEFKARQFYIVGKRLVDELETQLKQPSFEAVMGLATGEYLLCLALELMAKAYYLKAKLGPREAIYGHEVVGLFADGLLSDEQRALLLHSERYVVWAGRYPTPKWTKEHYKEGFDVASTMVDGEEQIDGSTVPTSASLPRSKDLGTLFEYIWRIWYESPSA